MQRCYQGLLGEICTGLAALLVLIPSQQASHHLQLAVIKTETFMQTERNNVINLAFETLHGMDILCKPLGEFLGCRSQR